MACAQITTEIPADPPTTTSVVVSTEPPEFSIKMKHVRSSTTSITIEWYVPYNYEDDIEGYEIKARKIDSEVVLSSPPLLPNGTLYEIENMVTKADYEICITATFKSDEEPKKECKEFSTLALIRFDSVIAMIIAIGYILLMVLIGVICWMCAVRRLKKKAKEDDGEEEEVFGGEEELLKPQETNNTLAPPPEYRPRNSIEEELPNIPYITPPLDELNRDGVTNRKGYNSANNI